MYLIGGWYDSWARQTTMSYAALSARKKDLVAGLLERYVNPDSPHELEQLRELAVRAAALRRVAIDLPEQGITVGHHSFQPAPAPDVLTATQAAELLAVEEQAIVELAEQGHLPGRKIAGEWRFARTALLRWLSAAPSEASAGA